MASARLARNRLHAALAVVALAAAMVPGAILGARQATPEVGAAPAPLAFPRDDGPHDVPTEWWYYTGHLFTETGERYGFEFVVFKAERGSVLAYASHLAITDNARGEFHYDERLVAGEVVSTPVPGGGFDLRVGDWRMSGANGEDRLVARLPGYAFSLETTSAKPPALHRGDAFFDYGSGQYTYYYSRTRLVVSGSLAVAGEATPVSGEAWMDHQWGDFTTWEDGGWDWFALQLDDGWELMLYVILAPDGSPEFVDGSLVAPDGSLTALEQEDFAVTATGSWTSPATDVAYPSGWIVEVPAADLVLTVTPALLDQELDTSASAGQVYWEGEVTIEGTRAGQPVGGLGYVELTGYADRVGTPAAASSGSGDDGS